MLNNPLSLTDPSGEFFWVAVAIGAFFGGATAAVQGGDFWDILGGALIGGIAAGAAQGYKHAKEAGMNPWTGKYDNSVAIGRNQNRVDMFAKDLGSETIRDDWTKKFGEMKISNEKSLDFNHKWFEGKLDSNYNVFDLGTGNYKGYSPNYTLELNSLQARNYQSINIYSKSYHNGLFRFIYY